MIVILTGLPGTGKSTLARALAQRLPGAVLDKDVIRAALFEPGRVEYSAAQDDFCQEIMLQTAAYLLAKDTGLHILLDGRTFSRRYQRERAVEFCREVGTRWAMLECVCAEQTALARLAEAMAQNTHPAANRTPELYRQIREAWEPIDHPRLIIDTDADLDSCIERAMRYLIPGTGDARHQTALKPVLASVKALVFDVFGTVVDWRGSVIAEGMAWGKAQGLNIDWAEFTDRWRLGYQPAMDKVRKGELPWTRLDDLHRMILENLLKEFKIEGLTEEDKVHWTRVWRRLKPWPDSIEGLTRLKTKYAIAPVSNGNIALMTRLASFGGLPWDAILGAELARHYKPDREVYISACDSLDLKPEEVMMCAAHVTDLQAARSAGLRTGFIYRPDEFGHGRAGVPDQAKPGDFDVVCGSIIELAQQMGA